MPNPRWRSADYLRWVAGLPCCACGGQGETQAHHMKGRGNLSGVGLRAADQWAMPLCARCHHELHSNPTPDTLNRQWEWAARTQALFIEWAAETCPVALNVLVKRAARG